MSVMIGTKVKDAGIWLPRFISQVEQLEGDILKIVVMYAQSQDQSFSLLKHWQSISKHKIEIYKDPYLPPSERHGAMLTRVKQDIQRLLEECGAEYYLNLDCDLVEIPQDTIPHLMAHDKDIIAGMVWTEARDEPVFFDSYVFRMDGGRFHPFNPPGLNRKEPFTVDSISTYYLAKAEVELAGVYSNPYPHIPFCKDLRDKGYKVWVDPTIAAFHIDLEAIGITHQPLPIALSAAPFIDDQGGIHDPAMIGALFYHRGLMKYDEKLIERRSMSYANSKLFLQTRPLLTASIAIWDDAEFLPYCLESIYPWVDRIDIVWGPVKLRGDMTYKEAMAKDGDTYAEATMYPDPDKKINLITGTWKSKEEIHQKLLEVCTSKWMLKIDADEVYTNNGMAAIRLFCEENQNGEKIYARPKRFWNFWGDFKHLAWSMNPLSPFAEFGVPHPMLVYRDIPGLNFAGFHTTPIDGFGVSFTRDEKAYPGRTAVLDDVEVFHFGNAKDKKQLEDKRAYYKARGDPVVFEDAFVEGELPVDMVIANTGDFIKKKDWPVPLFDHPRFGERSRIRITQRTPHFKFKWVGGDKK